MAQNQPMVRLSHLWPRLSRRLLLLALALTMAMGLVVVSWAAPADSQLAAGGNDLRLYRAILDRVREGEDYYQAAGTELRAQGYPSASIFNWRPPLYAWVLGRVSSLEMARLVLACLAMASLLLVYGVLYDVSQSSFAACFGTLAVAGSFLWIVDGDAFLAQELWAGVLITISFACYARGRQVPGLIAGLAALFFRELAAPYCLVVFMTAVWHGRKREVLGWAAGFVLYAAYFATHALEVRAAIEATDRAPASWLQFGGLQFVLATFRMNFFLFALPAWCSVLALPLALLGLTAWSGRDGGGNLLAATVLLYMVAFALVGQPFNDYWGLVYAPLAALGLALSPAALSTLVVSEPHKSESPSEKGSDPLHISGFSLQSDEDTVDWGRGLTPFRTDSEVPVAPIDVTALTSLN